MIPGLSFRQNAWVVGEVHRPQVPQHRPEVVVQRPASEKRGLEVAVVVLLHLRRPPRLPRSRDRASDDDWRVRHRLRHHRQLRPHQTLSWSGELSSFHSFLPKNHLWIAPLNVIALLIEFNKVSTIICLQIKLMNVLHERLWKRISMKMSAPFGCLKLATNDLTILLANVSID